MTQEEPTWQKDDPAASDGAQSLATQVGRAPESYHGALDAARASRPEPGADPSAREWLEHAKHGLGSLSDLYHDGGEKGDGITVREFRDGIDFVWRQIDEALAALPASPRVHDEACPAPNHDGPCDNPVPASPEDGLDVERITSFLHDEYGCRITCRGGRLADDRHPSHNEAYRDQAKRLVAALMEPTDD